MPGDLDVGDLHKTWVHSHEEDKEGNTVYRVSDFAFPRSRGRWAMTLRPDGVAQVGYPGPDDRSTTAEGSWSLEGKLLTVHAPGWVEEMEIDSVGADILVVRKIRREN